MDPETQTTAQSGWFTTTHWTVVLDTASQDSKLAGQALNRLCQTYWQPIYTFIRRQGHSPEDAKDLTQEFFARLLEKEYLKVVDRQKGKFRSFLLVVLKRFLANEWDKANCQKRAGHWQVLAIQDDAEQSCLAELVDHWTPEQAYDHRWARTVLQLVMNSLAGETANEGKAEFFALAKPFLTGEAEPNSYPPLAQTMGMTEGALRVAIHRLRQRYREILSQEIGKTVQGPEAVEEELRHLLSALA
jgi:RNA polymerase sigma factor (sigma-70 family)